uniref:B30.2/SPRY domain-containing protein n=1 Tax=Salmo trutta TaxID=8032 RepID=A0A674B8L9_SALTR
MYLDVWSMSSKLSIGECQFFSWNTFHNWKFLNYLFTIPCGHSYCIGCIKDCWDQDDQKGVYSCPQCRQTFIPRPVLKKSTLLAELVENLKKTGLQAAPPAHYYAGPGDVACDVCTERKLKFVKSCLVCLVSYCESHLQPHYESPAFKRHTLVKASTQLEEKICSRHDKLLEMYCRTDQQFICLLCVVGEHKGHDTVSAESERTECLSVLSDSEKVEVSRAEGLLKQLEQEMSELRRREAELEQLSHTEDNLKFLQSFQSLCVSPGSEVLPCITVNQHISFENVKISVTGLKSQVENICSGEIAKISVKAKRFRSFILVITHTNLCLSEGNRKVTWSNKVQSYPDHPDRFTTDYQVLCREGLSGSCYWEVEWSGWEVNIAVSYKGISRRGPDEWFGKSNQAWCLRCGISRSFFYHNSKQTVISVPCFIRVGVYLDHKAGTLSFYSVSDTMTLLHRVQTTFTQPLYPGFYVSHGFLNILSRLLPKVAPLPVRAALGGRHRRPTSCHRSPFPFSFGFVCLVLHLF